MTRKGPPPAVIRTVSGHRRRTESDNTNARSTLHLQARSYFPCVRPTERRPIPPMSVLRNLAIDCRPPASTTLAAVTRARDRPARFRNSKAVGASFGLTPTKYQSGEIDRTGAISRCGDAK